MKVKCVTVYLSSCKETHVGVNLVFIVDGFLHITNFDGTQWNCNTSLVHGFTVFYAEEGGPYVDPKM